MLLLTTLLGAPALAGAPEANVTYALEMMALDLGRLDDALEDYAFTPVGRRPLFSHAVRGTLVFDDTIWAGLNARTAASIRGRDAAVPTVVQATWMGVYGAYTVMDTMPGGGTLRVGGDLGVATLTEAVGSAVQAGRLAYAGPYLQPRATWRVLTGPAVVDVTAGWMFHTPTGSAHDNPLWEEPFDRGLIQGPTLSIHSGMTTGGWQ